jgi:hypothetical protein
MTNFWLRLESFSVTPDNSESNCNSILFNALQVSKDLDKKGKQSWFSYINLIVSNLGFDMRDTKNLSVPNLVHELNETFYKKWKSIWNDNRNPNAKNKLRTS